MKSATVLPSRKIVPEGDGSLVQPLRGYDDVFTCIFWTVGTAWMRLIPSESAPSYADVKNNFFNNPSRWMCIANNR
jgi:hypothetical protein